MNTIITSISSLGLFFLLFFSFGFTSDSEEVKHKIKVIHPGKDLKEPLETILIERLNNKQETLEFYINVESVICTDNSCKIVPVNIFWDSNGEYKRIELEENDYLEKIKGVEFTDSDYLKLEGILRNKNSALADYNINEILDKNKKGNQDVDAVSGATVITIDESETIVGATLTCYTLWHWVNGPVPQIIKEISVKKLSDQNLINVLSTAGNRQLIAVEELTKRKQFNKTTRSAIVENITTKNKAYRKKAFAYIAKLPKTQYFDALTEIFSKKAHSIRIKALYLVEDSPYKIPENFSVFLTKNIIEIENQKEVEKLLDIFQDKAIDLSSTNKEIIKLLRSKDFSIARSTYEFLKDKPLTNKGQKVIRKFYNTHKATLEKANVYSGF